MNCLSFALLVGILLGTILNCYGQSVTIQKKTINGVDYYIYNGKTYNSRADVDKQLAIDYPNVIFGPPSSEGGNSNGGNSNTGSSGMDISKYKGNNPFSNAIFDRIWQGYNVNSDSRNGFSDMKNRFMQESNEYRKAHGASALQLDSDLANKAQKYAEYIASIGKLIHDPKNSQEKMGENLAYGSTSIGHLGVKWWYDEIKDYDFNRPGFSSGTGHFTQLVWKASTKAGFGVAEKKGALYVVCKYTPAGNMQGEFPQNVLKRNG